MSKSAREQCAGELRIPLKFLDKAKDDLAECKKERDQYKELLRELVKHSEHGARQWADAWNNGEDTAQIRTINKIKAIMESE